MIASKSLAVTFCPGTARTLSSVIVPVTVAVGLWACASRRDCRHLRWRGLGRRLAQPDDNAAGITRLAKVDMSLLHVRSEGTLYRSKCR